MDYAEIVKFHGHSCPGSAIIYNTVSCDRCHESVMATRLQTVAGRMLCIPCAIGSAGE